MYVCRFAHGDDTFPLGTTSLLEGSSGFKKLTPKLVPIRPKKLPQHVGAMSWHHAKFHDFQACFGFTGIKKPSFQSFRASHDAQMFEFHSHLLHGTYKFTQGHTCDFSNNFGALEHVLVVQIMHIKCAETQLMYKKGQTSPKKFQNFKQHSCCSYWH